MINLAALPIQQLRTLAALNALTTPEQPCSVSDVSNLTRYTLIYQYETLHDMMRKNMLGRRQGKALVIGTQPPP